MSFILLTDGFVCLCAISIINSIHSVDTLKVITILIVKQGLYDLYDGCYNDSFLIWICTFIFCVKQKRNKL